MIQHKLRRYLKHGMLPQLSVFEAVARHGNYTKAGEELFMAQPTVSVQMKKLTETVGTPLVEQIGKRIYLTEAGKMLYAACQEVFGTLRTLDSKLANLGGLSAGRLQLAVSTTARHFAPRMLADFAKHHPHIQLSLQIHNRHGLLERMADNLDDLYIFDNPPTADEQPVVTQRILPNPMVALAAPGHRLAGRKQIAFEEFAAEPFLMREPGSGTRMVAEALFATHGLQPEVRMELASNEAIREAIAAGLGVSILSRYTLGQEAPAEKLVMLDVVGLPVEQHWVFAYPIGKQLPATAENFMSFTRRESKEIALNYLSKTRLQ
jgi:DNA-binding transcriptional LysR family regulator